MPRYTVEISLFQDEIEADDEEDARQQALDSLDITVELIDEDDEEDEEEDGDEEDDED